MPQLIDSADRYDSADIVQTLRQIQPGLRPTDSSDGYDLVRTLSRRYTDVYDTVDELYEQRLVESASGSHLDRLGAKYDVERRQNEDDEALRTRIVATRKASLSDGTYSDIADVAATALDVGGNRLDVRRPSETGRAGIAEVRVPDTEISDAPLTKSDVVDLLRDAAVGGHRIELIEANAFTFGDANNGFGTEWANE